MAIEKEIWHEVNEKSRTYSFPGGDTVTVVNVIKIKVSVRDTHHLINNDGEYIIIRNAWLSVWIDGEAIDA